MWGARLGASGSGHGRTRVGGSAVVQVVVMAVGVLGIVVVGGGSGNVWGGGRDIGSGSGSWVCRGSSRWSVGVEEGGRGDMLRCAVGGERWVVVGVVVIVGVEVVVLVGLAVVVAMAWFLFFFKDIFFFSSKIGGKKNGSTPQKCC